jgi:hypothetical protein
MLQIEPIEEVVTKRKVVVTIDENEMAKILVDARPFQKMLRKQKSAWRDDGRSTWSASGHADGNSRTKKQAAQVAQKGKGRLQCQWGCGKRFQQAGWKARHEEICASRDIGTVQVGE